MKSDIWDAILYFYKKRFNIPNYVIEYIAVEEVLKLCVQGYCNTRIARRLDIDKKDVKYVLDILEEYLNFSGWTVDLDFSPISVYNNSNKDLVRFTEECAMISSVTDTNFVNLAYWVCVDYDKVTSRMKKEIEKYVR